MEVRRKDRQVTQLDEIDAILGRCEVGHIGLCDGGTPYVVPVNFAHRLEADGTITVFVHGAREGRRQVLAASGGRVCFEASRQIAIVSAGKACEFTTHYESVIGFGPVEILSDPDTKRTALGLLAAKHSGGQAQIPADQTFEWLSVWSIRIDEVTSKRNLG